jgi:preprotein translocase subunit YajC
VFARRRLTPREARMSHNVVFSLFLQAAATPNSSLLSFLPILLIFGIFYFLLFLPMQKQRKQQQKMLSSLQNGNTVVTSGGIVGTIVSIDGDDTVVLRVKPDNVKIQVARSAVSSVVSSDVKK